MPRDGQLRADRGARDLRRDLDHLAVGAAGHAGRAGPLRDRSSARPTRTTRCWASSPRCTSGSGSQHALRYYVGDAGGDDPDHRHQRRADRDLAAVVVARRAPPAAGAPSRACTAATARRGSRSSSSRCIAALLLIPGKTDFLGNLYIFGAMLSFTTAHVAVIALRVQGARRSAPVPRALERAASAASEHAARARCSAPSARSPPGCRWWCCTTRRGTVGIGWMVARHDGLLALPPHARGSTAWAVHRIEHRRGARGVQRARLRLGARADLRHRRERRGDAPRRQARGRGRERRRGLRDPGAAAAVARRRHGGGGGERAAACSTPRGIRGARAGAQGAHQR